MKYRKKHKKIKKHKWYMSVWSFKKSFKKSYIEGDIFNKKKVVLIRCFNEEY